MRTIGVVTGARSDWNVYVAVLRRMQMRGDLRARLYVTGMHLSRTFGHTVDQIEADGFSADTRIPTLVEGDSPEAIAASMGRGMEGFARAFTSEPPDMLLVHGDRYEMFAAASAALPFNIPVAHVAGGDVTEGAFDDALRHSITKLSHLHFVANEEAGKRVRQLGEEPWRIHVTGDPAVDLLLESAVPDRAETARRFGLVPDLPALLVTFHSVTLEYAKTADQITALVEALEPLEAQIVLTYPNADPAGRTIIAAIEALAARRPRTHLAVNASREGYLGLLATVDAMLGNSSSGLIEAPSFELPVVNVGIRQRGRVRGANVIDCAPESSAIRAAVARALSPEFRRGLNGMGNPYGDGHAAGRIVEVLATEPLDQRLVIKRFADLPA